MELSVGPLSGFGLILVGILVAIAVVIVLAAVTVGLAVVMRRLLGAPVGWPRTFIVALLMVGATVGLVYASVTGDGGTIQQAFEGVNLLASLFIFLIALIWMFAFGAGLLMLLELVFPTGSLPNPFQMVSQMASMRVRNRRYREVLSIFVRNGLGVPFQRRRAKMGEEVASQFRLSLEQAGPTFVKLGQNLSTRSDVLPSVLTDELSRLQADVPPSDWEGVHEVLRQEIDGEIDDLFAEFDRQPIAAASVAQVHRARLYDGTEVAVKVQRPGAMEEIMRDSDILIDICAWLERNTEWGATLNIRALARTFATSLREEMDYSIEAENMQDLGRALRGTRVLVPSVYQQESTDRMLVMDFFDGPTIGQAHAELSQLPPATREQLGADLVGSVLDQIMMHGVFHADIHPGNVSLLHTDKGPRLGLLDYGNVGRIDRRMQRSLTMVISAIDTGDTRLLLDSLKSVLTRPKTLDQDRLEYRVGELLAYYRGGVNLSLEKLVADIMSLVSEFKFTLPPNVAHALRSLSGTEGTLLLINPNANVVRLARSSADRLTRYWASPRVAKETAEAALLDIAPIATQLPRNLATLVEESSQGRFVLNMRFFADSKERAFVSDLIQQFTLAILSGFCLISGVILLAFGNSGPPLSQQLYLLQGIGFIILVAGFMLALRIVTKVLFHSDQWANR